MDADLHAGPPGVVVGCGWRWTTVWRGYLEPGRVGAGIGRRGCVRWATRALTGGRGRTGPPDRPEPRRQPAVEGSPGTRLGGGRGQRARQPSATRRWPETRFATPRSRPTRGTR